MLEVRNLAFSFGKQPVLRDVSFVVSPGEIVSIIGANGAGKTTLLRILATLVLADRGQVLYDGQNAFGNPLKYRRLFGYLSENHALDDDMTVKDYLSYRAQFKGELTRRIRRRVSDAAELCRITDLLNHDIRHLSLGQRKRIAFADAILLRPRILFLDDFLAGLDQTMRQAMGEILSNAAAFSSVIVTGHEIADFARWTTKFLVLQNGVISSTVTTAGIDRMEALERIESVLGGYSK